MLKMEPYGVILCLGHGPIYNNNNTSQDVFLSVALSGDIQMTACGTIGQDIFTIFEYFVVCVATANNIMEYK